jgi:hypothetical protein
MRRFSANWIAPARAVFVLLGLCAAIALFLFTVNKHYAIKDWLSARYGISWLGTLALNAGCVVAGHGLLRAILGRVLPIREQLVLAFPLGLLIYFWITFAVGLVGGLGTAYFFAIPFVLLALGARPSLRYGLRLARHVRYARRKGQAPRSPLAWLAVSFGAVCLAMIYFSILSPLNASWDSRWYHLPLAEMYASSGRIFRFAEGWVLGTYPQLPSLLYTWGFMLPKAQLFDRIALCAHLEYSVFVWTVVGVPVLARRVLPKALRARFRLRGSWAAMFLFPGLFLYDSSLNLGADHIATLWAVPIYLALLLAWPKLALRECCLLAVVISGALLTKYTSIMNAGPAILAVIGRAVWLLARNIKTPAQIPWRGPVAMLVLGLALTSAHWAKNWAWYGDPLYPQLMKHLTLRPWIAEQTLPYNTDIAVSWHAGRDLAGMLESAKIMFTFAFVHHDWPDLHGTMPIFGLLFTLSLFVLPMLAKAPRLWGLYAFGHFAVAIWTQISWQDRYLQCLVPWMAACVTAVLVQLWELPLVLRVPQLVANASRVLVTLLVALQIVWGADVYFYTVHRMMRSNPAKVAIDLLNTGRTGKVKERDEIFQPYQKIGLELPDGAVLLAHGTRQSLGLKHRRVVDSPGTQGGILYSRHKSPRDVYDQLKSFGVTHLMWDANSESNDTITSDFVFFTFAMLHTEGLKHYGSLRVARMPQKPPQDKPFGPLVTYLSCQGRYEPGLYKLHDLNVPVFVPPFSPKRIKDFVEGEGAADKLIKRADYLVVQPDCKRGASNKVLTDFTVLARRGTSNLYVRKTPEVLAQEAKKAEEAKKAAEEAAAKNKAANEAAKAAREAAKADGTQPVAGTGAAGAPSEKPSVAAPPAPKPAVK